MGFRDRFKKMLGRSKPKAKAEPPKPKVRAKAVYRTGSERRIEGAEHVLEEPPPTPEPKPAVEETPESPELDESPEPQAEDAPQPRSEVTWKVHLVNEDEGIDVVIEVAEDEYILDAAERNAVDLPSSCRNGGCYVCAGKVISGELDLSEDQVVLDEDHLAEGLTLLCCASPKGDVKVLTHQEDAVG